MFQATLVSTEKELQQIIELQKENLKENIDETELQTQGFVTLRHSIAELEQMHSLAPSVIIKDNEKLAAYALTMLKECQQLVPDLDPMFLLLDSLLWNGQPLGDFSYYVMGQICVAKEYRGKGLVHKLYEAHKKTYQPRFELLVTEIATRNHRSIRAHKKTGFKTIHTYRDAIDEWNVVVWDWN